MNSLPEAPRSMTVAAFEVEKQRQALALAAAELVGWIEGLRRTRDVAHEALYVSDYEAERLFALADKVREEYSRV